MAKKPKLTDEEKNKLARFEHEIYMTLEDYGENGYYTCSWSTEEEAAGDDEIVAVYTLKEVHRVKSKKVLTRTKLA